MTIPASDAISFDADYFADITCSSRSSWTTFVHAGAKLFLEMYADSAAKPEADKTLVDDYRVLNEWLGAGSWPDLPMDERQRLSSIFAGEFERYLTSHISPTPASHDAFSNLLQDCRPHSSAALDAVLDRMLGESRERNPAEFFHIEDDVAKAAAAANVTPPLDRILAAIYGSAYRNLYHRSGMSEEVFVTEYAIRFLPHSNHLASPETVAAINAHSTPALPLSQPAPTPMVLADGLTDESIKELSEFVSGRDAEVAVTVNTLPADHVTRVVARTWARQWCAEIGDDNDTLKDYILAHDTEYQSAIATLQFNGNKHPHYDLSAIPTDDVARETALTWLSESSDIGTDEALFEAMCRCIESTPAIRKAALEEFKFVAYHYSDSDFEPLAVLARQSKRQDSGSVEKAFIEKRYGEDIAGLQLANPAQTRWVFFSVDVSEVGRVRMTTVTEDGPLGHTTSDTYQSLLKEALSDGYRLPYESSPIDRIAPTARFLRGAAINTEFEHLNRGLIDQKTFDQRVTAINLRFSMPTQLGDLELADVDLNSPEYASLGLTH